MQLYVFVMRKAKFYHREYETAPRGHSGAWTLMISGLLVSRLQTRFKYPKSGFTWKIKGPICMISKSIVSSNRSMINLLKGSYLKIISVTQIWINGS